MATETHMENKVEVYTTFSKTWGAFDSRRVAYIGKKQIFDAWSEIFIRLDGQLSTLEKLKVSFETNLSSDGILQEIQKLNGGRQRVFEHYIQHDAMVPCQQTIAEIFKRITQGTFIRPVIKNPDDKPRIYRYNSQTQLWDNMSMTNLKSCFIELMKVYMCAITPMLNKKHFEEEYSEKDKDEKDIYFKRLNVYKRFIGNSATINSIIEIFKSIVAEEDTLFELAPEYDKYICFRNGIYNLDTSKFRHRDISDRFTRSLDWDYGKTCNKAILDDIHTFFTKIQPDREQRKFTVSFLKYCLKGGNPQAKFKMNIGYTAANGKTTEMDIHEKAFPLYTEKLDRTIFSKTCTKRHKYANKLVTCPIRLAYINELDDSKLDEDFLKDFADGKDLPLEQMYGTMCNNSRIQCKLITTSNKDPNLLPDGGVIRRATIQQYTSRFVSKDAVDENNNNYLLDPTWVDTRLSQDAYKLAYFHFLLKEGHTAPLIIPEANLRLVTQTLNENDDFLPQLEQLFVITKESTDKVSYLDIQRSFPNMQVRVLNGHLKRLGITYDKNGSTHSIRKVYRGIRKYTENEANEFHYDPNLEFEDPE